MHHAKCLSIIMLDSVIKAKKEYYPQTLLEECKYEPRKIKMKSLTDDDLEKSSSDESGVNLIMMKWNLTMKKIMTSLMKNLLKAKKDINNKSNE